MDVGRDWPASGAGYLSTLSLPPRPAADVGILELSHEILAFDSVSEYVGPRYSYACHNGNLGIEKHGAPLKGPLSNTSGVISEALNWDSPYVAACHLYGHKNGMTLVDHTQQRGCLGGETFPCNQHASHATV